MHQFAINLGGGGVGTSFAPAHLGPLCRVDLNERRRDALNPPKLHLRCFHKVQLTANIDAQILPSALSLKVIQNNGYIMIVVYALCVLQCCQMLRILWVL